MKILVARFLNLHATYFFAYLLESIEFDSSLYLRVLHPNFHFCLSQNLEIGLKIVKAEPTLNLNFIILIWLLKMLLKVYYIVQFQIGFF